MIRSSTAESAARALYSKMKSMDRFRRDLADYSTEDFVDWVLGEEGLRSGNLEVQIVLQDDIIGPVRAE